MNKGLKHMVHLLCMEKWGKNTLSNDGGETLPALFFGSRGAIPARFICAAWRC